MSKIHTLYERYWLVQCVQPEDFEFTFAMSVDDLLINNVNDLKEFH